LRRQGSTIFSSTCERRAGSTATPHGVSDLQPELSGGGPCLRAMPDSLLPKDLVDPAVLDAVLCIETYLRPSLRGAGSAMEQAAAQLAAGGLVAIREAFEPAFAERTPLSTPQRCDREWR